MDSLYKKTARLIKPYWGHLVLSASAAMFYAAMSGAMIWLIGPLLGTLFSGTDGQLAGLNFSSPGIAQVQTLTQNPADSSSFTAKISGYPDRAKLWIKSRIDSVLVRKTKTETLVRICWAVLLVALLKNFFTYFQGFFMAFVQQSLVRDIRNRLFEHYQKLSLSYFHTTRTGQLISRVTNDVVVFNDTVDIGFNYFISDTISVVMLITFLIILSWKLMLLAALVLPVIVFFIYQVGRKLRKYSARSQERMADVNSVLEETVTNIRIVKAFAADKFEINKFFAATSRYFKALLRMTRVRNLASPINDMVATFAGVFILWYAGTKILSAESTLRAEDFILFVFSMFSLIKPIKSLSNIHIKVQEGMAAAGRIFEVLETPLRVTEPENPVQLPDFTRSLKVHDVVFSYDTGDRVLDHISFEVKKGEILALVGPSGAGKSTLFDLLPRFYDPQSGNIEIDGIDIRTVSTASLRALMGIVTQETFLFNDSVYQNIAYGMNGTPQDKVVAAAEMANAHEFIQHLPKGYDTIIGNRGVMLSGGQRQAVAIGKSIYWNAKLLIMDEPTRGIDVGSKYEIYEIMNSLSAQGISIIFVSSEIEEIMGMCDRAVVMSNFEIVGELTRSQMTSDAILNLSFKREIHR